MKNILSRHMLVTAVLCAGLFTAGCTTYNAATGRQEMIFISTSEEVAMGKQLHEQLSKEYKFSNDSAKKARVNRVGQKLAQVSDRQDYAYQFFVIEQDEENAFTIPGGQIYIFTGLLDKLANDDELAAVLGHEIGHCSARHTIKKFQAALSYNLVGSLVLSQVSPEAQQLAAMSSNAAMNLIFSAYGRQDEYQSDKLGIKYMRLAGYDLNGMIKLFEVLKRESKGTDVPLLLRSHPYLDDRIVAARAEIERIQAENK